MEKIGLVGFVACWLLVAGSAWAQPEDQVREAQAHFKRGAAYYDEDNFRGALVEFQRAYELSPSYKILFNIGQVQLELQDFAGAQRAFTRYLREGGPDVPAARVEEVNHELERLSGRVGELTIQTAAGAEVLIDDASVGFAPLPEPVAVNVGRHQVAVHISGREPQRRVVDVAGQQQLTVALATDAVTKRASPSSASPPAHSGRSLYVTWSVTGALALTASVFTVLTYTNANKLEDLRDTYPITKAELDAQADKQKTTSLYADVFAGATAVAIGVSLYLTLSRTKPSRESSRAARLGISPRGAFVTGSF
jgi:tetratricopeptide (TPR) repeat protein